MNVLLEPHMAPQLPDLLLLDDEVCCGGADDAWASALSLCGGLAPSAPVPISSQARAARMSPSSELVDSLESSASLLSASLRQDAASAEQYAMRFVPVSASPEPQPFAPHTHTAQQSYWGPGEVEGGLLGGYSVAGQPSRAAAAPAPPTAHGQWGHSLQDAQRYNQHHLQQYGQPYGHRFDSGSAPAWDLGAASLPPPPPAGLPSRDACHGFPAQFGGQMGLPVPSASVLRRAASEAVLHRGAQPSPFYGAGLLAPVAEGGDSLGSEGSDADTYGEQHERRLHAPAPQLGLPASHSAPSMSLMALERSASNRRSLLSSSTSRGGGHATPSPRPICLKVKAPRARPAAARAAAAAAAAAASPRPARASARRSMALSAAVADEGEEAGVDSDVEPEASMEACEERRSGMSSGAVRADSGCCKKKHNPWSLTETEALVEGVRLLGPSKWAEIKKLANSGIADLLAARSAVDLKDKWRNLTRVAKLPKTVLKARAHKSTSEIPLELLLAVKDLMEVGKE